MDRLLSDQEQAGLIWELSATIEGSEGRQPTQQEIHEYLLKAQDAKTASLVAQEIFDELNKPCTHNGSLFKRECITCKAEIRSKYIEGKNG